MPRLNIALEDRIIPALDVNHLAALEQVIAQLVARRVTLYKVGLQIITSMGVPEAGRFLKDLGARAFFDLKLDDIPNTMAQAAANAVKAGAAVINVHASAGVKGMKAVVAECGDSCEVWAVTVLTSLDNHSSLRIFGAEREKAVLNLAHMALDAGVHGLICSAQEATAIRREAKLGVLSINTPALRPEWAMKNDQSRDSITTPGDAIRAGADRGIIGRPLTQPPESIGGPIKAFDLIQEEIKQALVA